MEHTISKKSRLYTLLSMFCFPGLHNLYVGKTNNGIIMLIIGLVINLNFIILINFFNIHYFIQIPENLALFIGLISVVLISLASIGFLALLAISIYFGTLISHHYKIISILKLLDLEINPKSLLNITIILLLILASWTIKDLITISFGSFRDKKNLPLIRKHAPYKNSKKSNIIAILLCFFLGSLGAHRFYLKKYKSAAILLGFFVASYTFGLISINNLEIFKFISIFLILISYAWSLSDLFLLCIGRFTDVHNHLPKDYSNI